MTRDTSIEPPSIADELERKTIEALTTIAQKLDDGEMSNEAGSAALAALWEATAGLTSRETMTLISEAKDAVQLQRKTPRRRVFGKLNATMIVDLPEPGACTAWLHINTGKGAFDTRDLIGDEELTDSEAAKRVKALCQRLVASGYEEILTC